MWTLAKFGHQTYGKPKHRSSALRQAFLWRSAKPVDFLTPHYEPGGFSWLGNLYGVIVGNIWDVWYFSSEDDSKDV